MRQDKYTWRAIYNDGTSLSQVENAYADIDRTKLQTFEILDPNGKVIFSLPLEPTERLIWRRRTEMSPGKEVIETCHIIGKQETVNGENRQVVFALFESDGHVEVSDKWDEKHPWFFPVTIHPAEGEEE